MYPTSILYCPKRPTDEIQLPPTLRWFHPSLHRCPWLLRSRWHHLRGSQCPRRWVAMIKSRWGHLLLWTFWRHATSPSDLPDRALCPYARHTNSPVITHRIQGGYRGPQMQRVISPFKVTVQQRACWPYIPVSTSVTPKILSLRGY